MSTNKYLIAAVVALATASATLSTARPVGTTADLRSVTISTAGVDVDSPVGAQHLLSAVRAAAEVVCGDKPDMRDLARTRLYGACVSKAVHDTVRRSNLQRMAEANGERPILEAAR